MTEYTVEAIEKIKRRKARYKCKFQNGDSIEINEELYFKKSLSIGVTLSEEQFVSLKREAAENFAREFALRLISIRVRSENELFLRLKNKGFDISVVLPIINNLKEMNLVNDKDFSVRFVNDLLMRKPAGELLLKAELGKKGISKEIIEEVLTSVFQEFDQTELAKNCIEKWSKTHPVTPVNEQRQKLTRFLYQRGFSWTIIQEVTGDISAFE